MAKPRPAPKPSKRKPDLLVYTIGTVVVIALLAFSLSRAMRRPVADTSALPESAVPTSQPAMTTVAGDTSGAPPALPPVTSPRAGEVAPPNNSIQPPVQSSAPTTMQIAAVSRVNSGELMKMVEAANVTIIDVRDVDSYKVGHIPGALHIPLAYIAGEVPHLPKNKPIVTYCTWPAEESSAGAALQLENAGIKNVSALQGGLDDWQRSGYPIETGVPKQ